MNKGKSPAFQLYPNDLMNDEVVRLMSNRELGAYVKLLCFNWMEKSIPKDPEVLSRLVGEDPHDFEPMWTLISKKFKPKATHG